MWMIDHVADQTVLNPFNVNLYLLTSGQQKQQNTKHKYSRSEMSTSVEIIMTIIWQELPAFTYES